MEGTGGTLRLLLLLMVAWQVFAGRAQICDTYAITTDSTSTFAIPFGASTTPDCQDMCTSLSNCFAYIWNTTAGGTFECYHVYEASIGQTSLLGTNIAVKNCQVCETHVDIAFILDGSGSISSTEWGLMLDFVANIINTLPENSARVGAVVFSTRAQVRFNLNTYSSLGDASAAVLSFSRPGDNTNTSGGLYLARKKIFVTANGDRPNVPNFAIVMTDGMSNTDQSMTIPMAEALRQAGIEVLAIGISNADEDELRMISSPPRLRNRNYFITPNFQQLQNILANITAIACDFTTPMPITTTTTPTKMTPTTTPSTTPTTSMRTTTPVVCPPDDGLGTDLVVVISCFAAIGGLLLGMLLTLKCCPAGKYSGWTMNSYSSQCNVCSSGYTSPSVQGCNTVCQPNFPYAIRSKPMVGPLPSYSCNGGVSFANSCNSACY